MSAPATLAGTHARPRRRAHGLLALVGLVALTALLAAGLGAVRIAPSQVLAILANRAGLPSPAAFDASQAAVLLHIRLPRIVLGALVGAALATAGATLQGLFRNPLADPGLLGVSSGAALAAAATIVLGRGALARLPAGAAPWALPVAALAGGLLATRAVAWFARGRGPSVATTMLLAGVAVNALAGAGTAWFTFAATDAQLRSLTFWTLGSLGAASWASVLAAAPFLLVALVGLPRLARPLNAMLLGEAEAAHLGVSVARTRRAAVGLSALAVGASVAFVGVVGFVGLVVPHVVRLAAGPDHRTLLPASALLGASLLVLADLAARTVVVPAELPLGAVTAAAGAPFFLWLLRREASRGAP
jgi:iron complex transport system permease protein